MAVIKRTNPSSHAITKISRILGTWAMLKMGKDKSIKKAQYHYSILNALQEDLSDQVV